MEMRFSHGFLAAFGLAIILLIAGCGGGGGGNTINVSTGGNGETTLVSTGAAPAPSVVNPTPTPSTGSGITISGKAWDAEELDVPLQGATITLRNSANQSLKTTTAGTDGAFTVTDVPASTEVYLSLSASGYATWNSKIYNLTSSVSGVTVISLKNATMVETFNAFGNGAPVITTWGDAASQSMCWVAVHAYSATGKSAGAIAASNPPTPQEDGRYFAQGLTLSSDSGATTVYAAYNDGHSDDTYTTDGSTQGGTSCPPTAAYGPAAGVSNFTLTDGVKTRTYRLPLVRGEVADIEESAW